MTTFSQLQEDVIALTNHPELTVETTLAIRMATLKLHLLEYWEEDSVEVPVSVTQTDGLYQIDIPEDISPLAAKIKYLQKADGKFLKKIDPVDAFDEYTRLRTNVYYRVGKYLKCRSNTSDLSVLVGYQQAPVTTESGYSSWIADAYPHLVAVEAAANVMNAIGETDMVKRFQALAMEGVALLKINHLPQT